MRHIIAHVLNYKIRCNTKLTYYQQLGEANKYFKQYNADLHIEGQEAKFANL
jgi:hypothetical protein